VGELRQACVELTSAVDTVDRDPARVSQCIRAIFAALKTAAVAERDEALDVLVAGAVSRG
jgi:hypothetical protein